MGRDMWKETEREEESGGQNVGPGKEPRRGHCRISVCADIT